MLYQEMVNRINEAYEMINARIELVKSYYEEKGIVVDRISYEDVSIDDLLHEVLLPLLPILIERFSGLPSFMKVKVYRIYIATLCELLKNGLVERGINKTIENYIGPFVLSHHYKLLKAALEYEGIPVVNKTRKYEETLINEAGIPRHYHKKCLEFFNIYWKWLHDFDNEERHQFLVSVLEGEQLERVYILDPNERIKMDSFTREAAQEALTEKVKNTCFKLDRIFSSIDSHPEAITNDNLEKVVSDISSNLGFNIFTVIRSSNLKDYLLAYAKKVSFKKFAQLLKNFPENELIVLPNHTTKENSSYNYSNYIGGSHFVRGTQYDVTYSCALSINDIFNLDRNEVYRFGTAVLYTSELPIEIEENGYEKTGRSFYHPEKGNLFVYYDRIKPASFLYIDGEPIQNDMPFQKKTYISKYWDKNEKHHKLAFTVYSLQYANPEYDMVPARLLCNGEIIEQGTTNRSGSYRIYEKSFPIDELLVIDERLELEFYVGKDLIDSWECSLQEYYLWGRYSGLRVNEMIDLATWYSPKKVILFSKSKITTASVPFALLYSENDYYVYEGSFEESDSCLQFNEVEIPIVETESLYIKLLSEFSIISEKICLEHTNLLAIEVHGNTDKEQENILQIEHENELVSYNLNSLTRSDYGDICGLLKRTDTLETTNIGEWNIALYTNSVKVSSISVVILPDFLFIPSQNYYSDNAPVEGIIYASEPCFMNDGEYIKSSDCMAGYAEVIVGETVEAKSLEVVFYVDRCDVSYRIDINPKVWSVREKDKRTEKWNTICEPNVDLRSLDELDYYICSNCGIELGIKAPNFFLRKSYTEGIHYFSVKDLIINPEKKTEIEIKDENEHVKTILISYSSELRVDNLEYSEELLVLLVKYSGPINVHLTLRAFNGENLIYSTKREANYNNFSIRLPLKRKLLTEDDISLEAKIDSGDYQAIYSGRINYNLFPDDNHSFTLAPESTLLEILSLRLDNTSGQFQNSLIHLLEKE